MMGTATQPDPDATESLPGPADLPLVIAEWERLSGDEPWHVDPHLYGLDSVHQAIRAILEIAAGGHTAALAAERLVRAAAAHGEQRRAQGTTGDALLREYHALRAAIHRIQQRSSPQAPVPIGAVGRLDVAIGVATIVALRGFQRRALAPGISWEGDMLQQVAAVSRHLADQFQAGGRS